MITNKFIKLVSILLLLQFPIEGIAQKITGIATHVKDGDSFLMKADGKTVEVRLDGIDCPEKSQPFSAKAKQFSTSLLLNKTITVKIKGYDKYKRALGVVFLPGNRILNEELLKAGLAWHYKEYNKEIRLSKMEAAARKSRVGLWDDPHPIPPWEYRQMQRNKIKPNTK